MFTRHLECAAPTCFTTLVPMARYIHGLYPARPCVLCAALSLVEEAGLCTALLHLLKAPASLHMHLQDMASSKTMSESQCRYPCIRTCAGHYCILNNCRLSLYSQKVYRVNRKFSVKTCNYRPSEFKQGMLLLLCRSLTLNHFQEPQSCLETCREACCTCWRPSISCAVECIVMMTYCASPIVKTQLGTCFIPTTLSMSLLLSCSSKEELDQTTRG